MQKPTWLKMTVIANTILLVAAFVGCPAHRDPIMPHIAPCFEPNPIASPPTHFQRLLPADGPDSASGQDAKENTGKR